MAGSVDILIEAKQRDLGPLTVKRALPTAKLRAIGPFVFLDQMGPVTFENDAYLDVPPHPHIGLSTLTWITEGAVDHRDSMGTIQTLRPGEVNWMTAGSGVVHSERTPADHRHAGASVSGLQAWIALPQAFEEVAPSFQHYGASEIPTRDEDGYHLHLIAGEAWGLRSPVKTYSETLYADIALSAGGSITLPHAAPERGVYVMSGTVSLDGTPVPEGSLALLHAGQPVTAYADHPSRIFLIGGAPLDGARHMYWNFVSSSKDRIEQAKTEWREQRFDPVPGETEFTPLP